MAVDRANFYPDRNDTSLTQVVFHRSVERFVLTRSKNATSSHGEGKQNGKR